MRKMSQTALRMTEKVVRVAVEKERKDGPPICPTLLHQPKRPITKEKER